jgi:predicted acetyltransferase
MAILKLTLERARELGLERVLVTCDEDNIASAKIIELIGGVIVFFYLEDETAVPKRRYWIDLVQGANDGSN